mgnify:CR=1 FL=1
MATDPGTEWTKRENDPAYRLPCVGDCDDNLLDPGSCPGWYIDFARITAEVYEDSEYPNLEAQIRMAIVLDR